MGIYIKGMEMPKNCNDCPCCAADDYSDYNVCQVDKCIRKLAEFGYIVPRPDWCPLIPVPDHGRLIIEDGEIVENS